LVSEGLWGEFVAYHVQVTPRPEAPEWCPFGGDGGDSDDVAASAQTAPKTYVIYRRFSDFKALQVCHATGVAYYYA
jgi:hypothetical protein